VSDVDFYLITCSITRRFEEDIW